MQLTTYVYFRGECEEAFTYYEQHLDGEAGPLFRYAGSPMADQAPPGWQDKIMHGSMTVGGHLLMGADVAPETYVVPAGFSLSLQMSDAVEAERVFHALADQGKVVMPLEKTFWAERFGMVVDRFGIPWLVNCEQGTL